MGDVFSDRIAEACAENFIAAPAGLNLPEGHFRKILDELPAAIYVSDALGRITYFNEAAATLWGHRPAIGTGEWCGSWKLFWPDGTPLPHGECPMAIAIREKRPVRGIEAVAERPDGTRVPFLPYPTPLFDERGGLTGAVNLLMDISDRKRAEILQQRLAAIVESSDDAIVSKNLDGTISSWNKTAERLFGYSFEEVAGQPITIIIPPERIDEEAVIIGKIKRGERVEHFETVRRRKDGSLVELSITVSPIRDDTGKIVGASKIARDISERRRAEQQRELLLGEMKHRTKNFATVVDAIARQSRPKDDLAAAELLDTFVGRLRALMLTGEIVVGSSERKAFLGDLFKQTLAPFDHLPEVSAFSLDGPSIEVSEQTAGGLALAIHELATNALKYGALKDRNGRVTLRWTADESGLITIEWKETGGPSISHGPDRAGFGSRVIRAAVAHERDASTSLSFKPDGVYCRFAFRPRQT